MTDERLGWWVRLIVGQAGAMAMISIAFTAGFVFGVWYEQVKEEERAKTRSKQYRNAWTHPVQARLGPAAQAVSP